MCAAQINPNIPNQCFTASPVRARGCQIRAPKKGILGGLSRDSYPPHVTVYPYNGCIGSTNPIVRHVMSLTWTPKRMHANQRPPKTCHNTTFTYMTQTHVPQHQIQISWHVAQWHVAPYELSAFRLSVHVPEGPPT